MAEYLTARPEWLHKFADDIDFKTASMIEPFSVAYNGIHGIGGCDASDTIVVLGGGTIGLCAVAAAKAMGAKVILIEPQEYRRKIGLTLKADYAFCPVSEDAVKKVKELTGGYGADLVVEAAGSSAALKSTFDLVKNGGRISFVGISIGNEISVELGKIQIKGITAKGFIGSPYVWDKAIAFLSTSKLDLSPISTHQFPLADAEKAYDFARDFVSNELVKVTLLNDN
jgi:L-iditol 2-dehydrogenase